MSPDQREQKIQRVQGHLGRILEELGLEGWDKDPHFCDTPSRVARMWVDELFIGLDQESKPEVRTFPPATDSKKSKERIQTFAMRDIPYISLCPHHLMPVMGKVEVELVAPHGSMPQIGLSKFPRLFAWVAAKPVTQEQVTEDFADEVEALFKDYVAEGSHLDMLIRVTAEHTCMTLRGVKAHAETETVSKRIY